MNTIQEKILPKLLLLDKKEQHKVLRVTGEAGMGMPDHISTKEAVVIVQEGEAIFEINNENFTLKKDDVFIIPTGAKHKLDIQSSFKAVVVMDVESQIEFIN
ncbi:MAG: cupin domain-containing protein [Ignavibacterium sp.]|jgi:quercetin dioxygenase-like cupin family protein|nr:MAG: cupin domain-containing protein [Ignavibacterium sp.]MDD5607244.1 cupin domain-containing protein [Ignavibacterium sp.]MDX9712185.1 cupin domain-containing protein [Ignavibacteriaceae bacterium]